MLVDLQEYTQGLPNHIKISANYWYIGLYRQSEIGYSNDQDFVKNLDKILLEQAEDELNGTSRSVIAKKHEVCNNVITNIGMRESIDRDLGSASTKLDWASVGTSAIARGKLYNEPEIITQEKIQKIYDSTPHEKSLEAVLFDSAISQSKNTPAIIDSTSVTPNVIPKKQSESIPTSSSYIAQKTKTWEGAEYLAGTIGVSVLGAFVPFGRGKSAIGQATKPILKTTPSSPNNLAYLLTTHPKTDHLVNYS